MKKIIPILVLIFIGLLLFFRTSIQDLKNNSLPTEITPTIRSDDSPLPTPPERTITYENNTYAYNTITTTVHNLSLIPNYIEQIDSSTLMETSTCTMGVNAGFYTPEKQPLGLVITNGETIHKPVNSSLVNGYFYIQDITPTIAYSLPDNSVSLAVQTGPILINDKNIVPLKIRNDEQARRVAVAVLDDNTIIFIIVYNPDALFGGPMLSKLPNIIDIIAKREQVFVLSAINLDGGSASFFKSKDRVISELSPIGALFCMK